MAALQTLRPGLKPFPGYTLIRLVGRGGFSEVWEAEVAGAANVALKFMPCDSGSAAAEEIRSIQKIRQLEHPNLVRIDRIWCHDNHIVIAMELADADLDDLVEAYHEKLNSNLPPEQICLYLGEIADALDFLNARQHQVDGRLVSFQHCDVKPGNMLLFGDTVKLADFGLSVQSSSGLRRFRKAGTLPYAAPEIFSGQVARQSDQHALAVSYCWLRGGRLPFPPVEAFTPAAVARRPPPDLSMLSPAEQPLIARALSRAPVDRWPSCSKLMRSLTRLYT